jgi:Ni/Fe-hydrogenase subunit HybB-like protein
MFGFVYAWYLMVVLILEIWFTYRKDIILWSQNEKPVMRWIHKIISLFSKDISEKAIAFDKKVVKAITIVGIPSAFLLHGYVGFIFGSIKANPWCSSVLMPIVFLFSAIVSGIALVIFLYMVITPMHHEKIDIKCLDKMASYLFYAVIIDFSLELLDFIHRMYESEESIKILSELVMNKLFISLGIIQVLLGMLLPLSIIICIKLFKIDEELRKLLYFVTVILIQLGIFATRWNVVVGGQMFSKSFRGLTAYKMEIIGFEGFLMTLLLLILPFIVLSILIKIFPPWENGGKPFAKNFVSDVSL